MCNGIRLGEGANTSTAQANTHIHTHFLILTFSMGISGTYLGTYSHGISHGNFCFPCGNLFPWNPARFPIDFLFPLISTGFSLDSHRFSTAPEMPMTFLWFSMVHFGRETVQRSFPLKSNTCLNFVKKKA